MSTYYDGNADREWPRSELGSDPVGPNYQAAIRALEIIEQMATGWKHGTEGIILLRIQNAARGVICPHAPVILHRSGGASADEQNSCGKCGRFIKSMKAPAADIANWIDVWVTDFEREEA